MKIDDSKIEELYGPGGSFYQGKRLGLTGADSNFSSRISMTSSHYVKGDFEDDESENEEEEMITKKRVYENGEYKLSDTLDNISDLNEGVFSILAKALKSGVMAVPGVDAIAGTFFLMQAATNVREMTDLLDKKINLPKGEFSRMLLSENDQEFRELMGIIVELAPEDLELFKDSFNELLESLKEVIIILYQAYDSIIAAIVAAAPAVAAGTFTAGTGAAALEAAALAGSNVTTTLSGFILWTIPVERLIFELVTRAAQATETFFSLFRESEGKLKDQVNQLEEAGGSIIGNMIRSPIQTLSRLGEFYDVVYGEEAAFEKYKKQKLPNISPVGSQEIDIPPQDIAPPQDSGFEDLISESFKNHSLSDILENMSDEEDEEFDEASGAGAVGGVTGKFGLYNPDGTKTSKKQHQKRLDKSNIYVEDVRYSQNWSNKTFGRIKYN